MVAKEKNRKTNQNCMAKKLQFRVCQIVSVRVLFFSVDGHVYAHCLYIPVPLLTAKSSNAARPLRSAFTWTWQLTYSITPIIVISYVVCS